MLLTVAPERLELCFITEHKMDFLLLFLWYLLLLFHILMMQFIYDFSVGTQLRGQM